jgi:uncharacterized protein (DUF427 family)
MSDEMKKKIEAAKASGYRIDISPCAGLARVMWRGHVIAQSTRAVVLNETRHNPVIYIPREDANMAMMARTTHTTHCPFKGDASYFSLVDGATRAENAVWSYETPIAEAAGIAQHLAFYTKAMGASFGIEVEAPGASVTAV